MGYVDAFKNLVAGGALWGLAGAQAVKDVASVSISALSLVSYGLAVVGAYWVYQGVVIAHDETRGKIKGHGK